MIEIRHRHTGTILASKDLATLKDALEACVHDGADLYGADLRGADLRGANLYGANLYGADLGGTDLYGANLGGTDLGGANLYGANLGGTDLGGANLYGADLYGADLYGADLRGANLRGAILSDHGKLIGRGILQIGPIGSRDDYLVAFYTETGIFIRAGCFLDTLAMFSEAVTETHGDNEHARDYRAAMALIEACAPDNSQ